MSDTNNNISVPRDPKSSDKAFGKNKRQWYKRRKKRKKKPKRLTIQEQIEKHNKKERERGPKSTIFDCLGVSDKKLLEEMVKKDDA